VDRDRPTTPTPPAVEPLLARTSRVLAGSLNVERTVDRLLGLLVPAHADWAQVTLAEDLGGHRVAVLVADGAVERRAWEGPPADRRASVAGVLLTGRRVRLAPVDAEGLAALTPDPDAPAGAGGAILPLAARVTTFGTLTLLGEAIPDLEVLADVAQRAALALDAARLYAERSHVAEVLQRDLRPPALPDLPGLRIAGLSRPADTRGVAGGDFFDVHGGDGDWTVVLGDVAGKGIEAAVLTGRTRQSVRTAALVDRSPRAILALLNAVLLAEGASRFVTLLCARLRPLDGGRWRLDVCAAGHPPPQLLTADGEVATIGTRGTVVGAVPDIRLEEASVTLRPVDACVIVTDGVTESRDADGTLFGEAGVAALLPGLLGAEPEAVVEHVARSALAHGVRRPDDLAVLALRVAP
jgi:phosphoserine phosphatase RsbU/P